MKQNICRTLLLLLFVAGCSESVQKPKELIPEDKYIDLIVELQLVRTYGEYAEVDSSSVDSLKSEVLRQYGESVKTFIESHQYYQQFPKEQQERVEKAIERLKMDKVEQDTTDNSSSKK